MKVSQKQLRRIITESINEHLRQDEIIQEALFKEGLVDMLSQLPNILPAIQDMIANPYMISAFAASVAKHLPSFDLSGFLELNPSEMVKQITTYIFPILGPSVMMGLVARTTSGKEIESPEGSKMVAAVDVNQRQQNKMTPVQLIKAGWPASLIRVADDTQHTSISNYVVSSQGAHYFQADAGFLGLPAGGPGTFYRDPKKYPDLYFKDNFSGNIFVRVKYVGAKGTSMAGARAQAAVGLYFVYFLKNIAGYTISESDYTILTTGTASGAVNVSDADVVFTNTAPIQSTLNHNSTNPIPPNARFKFEVKANTRATATSGDYQVGVMVSADTREGRFFNAGVTNTPSRKFIQNLKDSNGETFAKDTWATAIKLGKTYNKFKANTATDRFGKIRQLPTEVYLKSASKAHEHEIAGITQPSSEFYQPHMPNPPAGSTRQLNVQSSGETLRTRLAAEILKSTGLTDHNNKSMNDYTAADIVSYIKVIQQATIDDYSMWAFHMQPAMRGDVIPGLDKELVWDGTYLKGWAKTIDNYKKYLNDLSTNHPNASPPGYGFYAKTEAQRKLVPAIDGHAYIMAIEHAKEAGYNFGAGYVAPTSVPGAAFFTPPQLIYPKGTYFMLEPGTKIAGMDNRAKTLSYGFYSVDDNLGGMIAINSLSPVYSHHSSTGEETQLVPVNIAGLQQGTQSPVFVKLADLQRAEFATKAEFEQALTDGPVNARKQAAIAAKQAQSARLKAAKNAAKQAAKAASKEAAAASKAAAKTKMNSEIALILKDKGYALTKAAVYTKNGSRLIVPASTTAKGYEFKIVTDSTGNFKNVYLKKDIQRLPKPKKKAPARKKKSVTKKKAPARKKRNKKIKESIGLSREKLRKLIKSIL